MAEALEDLAEYIEEKVDAVQSHSFEHGELILTAKTEEIKRVLNFLRDDKECHCHQLMDITAVDYPERLKARF